MLIVTGSFPPDICGVGDYIQRLLSELDKKIEAISVFYQKDWSIWKLKEYARTIKGSGAEIINVQYPTEGYHYSIVPQLLCLAVRPLKTVVTLHEFDRKSLKGKLAIYLFFLFADWIILTNESEYKSALRVAPWIRERSCVIPIGSNIPIQPRRPPKVDVVYFGQIRPQKGLEEFLEIIERLSRKEQLSVQIIGQISPGYEDYASLILRKAGNLGAEIVLNKSADEVSTLLSQARIALLPFPHGMSLRHGSALAAMGNGALLLTRSSAGESDKFNQICISAQSTEEFCELIPKILNGYEVYDHIRISGYRFAKSISWEGIADSYARLFDQMIY